MTAKTTYVYSHPRPCVTVDAAIFTAPRPGHPREVLLIRRGNEPFKGRWALPGGFVEEDEDLAPAAARELEEETGLSGVSLSQFRTYGTPGRDPRHRTISVVYTGEIAEKPAAIAGSDDAAEARFFDAARPPAPLAFDHDTILREALAWIDGRGP